LRRSVGAEAVVMIQSASSALPFGRARAMGKQEETTPLSESVATDDREQATTTTSAPAVRPCPVVCPRVAMVSPAIRPVVPPSGDDVRVACFVVSCAKTIARVRGRRSWPTNFYFLLGDPQQAEPHFLSGGILHLRCSDAYLGLPEKMAAAFDAFCRLPAFSGYTHVYKVDDTDLASFRTGGMGQGDLLRFIGHHDYSGLYLNNFGPLKQNRRYHFKVNEPEFYWNRRYYTSDFVSYLQGGGYVLSRAAARLVALAWPRTDVDRLRRTEPYEDLMVGKALRRHQVLPVQLPPTMRGLLPVHDDMGSHGSRTPLLHLGASRCVGSSHWPSRAHSEPPWQSPTPEGWLH